MQRRHEVSHHLSYKADLSVKEINEHNMVSHCVGDGGTDDCSNSTVYCSIYLTKTHLLQHKAQ